MTIYLIISILTAIFISWIWVDYFRLIDIYDTKSFSSILTTFLLGAGFAFLVFPLNDYLMDYTFWELGRGYISDFLYCTVRIGMIEELVKIVPLIIIIKVFPKQFNEPIDYIGFACFSALGFAASENVIYMHRYDYDVIIGRAILAATSHMFNSAIVAYGFIWAKYRKEKKNTTATILLFFILASLSHGFYDFWLIQEDVKSYGFIITIIYFFLTISVFSTMITNAINNSKFFNYKKIIKSAYISQRLILYFVVLFILSFIHLAIVQDIIIAVAFTFGYLLKYGLLIVVFTIRLSRFKLIEKRWDAIKLEFPFSIESTSNYERGRYRIKVKGEGYDETAINSFYQEYCICSPISRNSPFLGTSTKGFIEKKLFLKNDETYYIMRIYKSRDSNEWYRFLVKPKTNGRTMMNEINPIVALLEFDSSHNLSDNELNKKDFVFKEWISIKSAN
ncbi:MAG: hypothetical protein COA58_00490 [Bacteroidetes bacterium]|nr:MAG: hypothetical protein COA58_00490 [Bacteroidota bacterium]